MDARLERKDSIMGTFRKLTAVAITAACLLPLVGCDNDRDVDRDNRDMRGRDTEMRSRGDRSGDNQMRDVSRDTTGSDAGSGTGSRAGAGSRDAAGTGGGGGGSSSGNAGGM
jgi:hypothetical protein